MELDKIPGFWVVTGWLDSGVALRLRIEHVANTDTNELFCEARIGRGDEFQSVGKVTSCIYEIIFEGESLFDDEGGPGAWKEEFREMARRWAVVDWIVQYGCTPCVRYPFEPASSRDDFETGDAYTGHPV